MRARRGVRAIASEGYNGAGCVCTIRLNGGLVRGGLHSLALLEALQSCIAMNRLESMLYIT